MIFPLQNINPVQNFADLSFRLKSLTRGKVYPCVGVDTTSEGVGLSFQVNFGNSPSQHPFKYEHSTLTPLRREHNRLTKKLVDMTNSKIKLPVAYLRRLEDRIQEVGLMIQEIDLEAQVDDYSLSQTERENTERLLREIREETEELARFMAARRGPSLSPFLGL